MYGPAPPPAPPRCCCRCFLYARMHSPAQNIELRNSRYHTRPTWRCLRVPPMYIPMKFNRTNIIHRNGSLVTSYTTSIYFSGVSTYLIYHVVVSGPSFTFRQLHRYTVSKNTNANINAHNANCMLMLTLGSLTLLWNFSTALSPASRVWYVRNAHPA